MPDGDGNFVLRYKIVHPTCGCGTIHTGPIKELGLTADHQLVMVHDCSACGTRVYTLQGLSDAWRSCPQGEEPATKEENFGRASKGRMPYGRKDRKFLHKLGVRLPDNKSSLS